MCRPGESLPPVTPQGWVVERQYNQPNLEESLGNFLAEREKALAWLHG